MIHIHSGSRHPYDDCIHDCPFPFPIRRQVQQGRTSEQTISLSIEGSIFPILDTKNFGLLVRKGRTFYI